MVKTATCLLGLVLLIARAGVAEVGMTVLNGRSLGANQAALVVSVLDETGAPIKGLTAEDFKVRVGGEPVGPLAVTLVAATDEHLSVVLGVDVSGSMKGRPFDETTKALTSFLLQLEKGDMVALFSFGSEVRLLTDFTTDRAEVQRRVEALSPTEQWTHLYDVTCEAIEKAKKALTTRAAVVLLTDGKDEQGRRTREQALSLARAKTAPVFTIGFGHAIERSYLEEVAAASGGRSFFTPEPARIAEIYEAILEQLKNQYLLSFDFARQPGSYKASVAVNVGEQTGEAAREFVFNPQGAPLVIVKETPAPPAPAVAPAPPQPVTVVVQERPLPAPWYGETWQRWSSLVARRPVLLAGLVAAAVALLLTGFVLLTSRRRAKARQEDAWRARVEQLLEQQAQGQAGADADCRLEFPQQTPDAPTFMQSLGGSKTGLASGADAAFLKVDCLKNGMVPLIYHGQEVIAEVLIARDSVSGKQHMQADAVYLWTPAGNNRVSRPKPDFPWHARIYLTEHDRFAIEDAGSANGTLVGGAEIWGAGVVLLQDGDVIDVGGKSGVRMVYRESDPLAA